MPSPCGLRWDACEHMIVLLEEDPWEDPCPTATVWACCGASRVPEPPLEGYPCLPLALPMEYLPQGLCGLRDVLCLHIPWAMAPCIHSSAAPHTPFPSVLADVQRVFNLFEECFLNQIDFAIEKSIIKPSFPFPSLILLLPAVTPLPVCHSRSTFIPVPLSCCSAGRSPGAGPPLP